MKIKSFLTCGTLLAALIIITAFYIVGNSIYKGKYAKVTFINDSGKTIKQVTIHLSGKLCSAKGLIHTGEVHCVFENLYDSGYLVEGTLDDGNIFKSNSMGYVTGGINFNDLITLNPSNNVTLVQGAQ